MCAHACENRYTCYTFRILSAAVRGRKTLKKIPRRAPAVPPRRSGCTMQPWGCSAGSARGRAPERRPPQALRACRQAYFALRCRRCGAGAEHSSGHAFARKAKHFPFRSALSGLVRTLQSPKCPTHRSSRTTSTSTSWRMSCPPRSTWPSARIRRTPSGSSRSGTMYEAHEPGAEPCPGARIA